MLASEDVTLEATEARFLVAVENIPEGFNMFSAVRGPGGAIVDVHGLVIDDPAALEAEIDQWAGVVCCGIFARHRASVCLLGRPAGVQTLNF